MGNIYRDKTEISHIVGKKKENIDIEMGLYIVSYKLYLDKKDKFKTRGFKAYIIGQNTEDCMKYISTRYGDKIFEIDSITHTNIPVHAITLPLLEKLIRINIDKFETKGKESLLNDAKKLEKITEKSIFSFV